MHQGHQVLSGEFETQGSRGGGLRLRGRNSSLSCPPQPILVRAFGDQIPDATCNSTKRSLCNHSSILHLQHHHDGPVFLPSQHRRSNPSGRFLPHCPTSKFALVTEARSGSVGTGTKWYRSGDAPINRDLIRILKSAAARGFTHIDGAEGYGTEEEVGIAIKRERRSSRKALRHYKGARFHCRHPRGHRRKSGEA